MSSNDTETFYDGEVKKLTNDYNKQAKVFKAFCDEKRLSILGELQSGEKCACVLIEQLGIAQSALSYHMKILCESGVVESRQEGKWTHYSISAEGSDNALDMLSKITSPMQLENREKCECE